MSKKCDICGSNLDSHWDPDDGYVEWCWDCLHQGTDEDWVDVEPIERDDEIPF